MARIRIRPCLPALPLFLALVAALPVAAQLETRSQTASNPYPVSVVAADFNNDGKMDIAVASHYSGTTAPGIQVFLGNGDGTFGPPTTYAADTNAGVLAVADLNHDGNADLVSFGTERKNGVAIVLLGNGDGTFQGPVEYSTNGEPYGLALGDFNEDGKVDIAVTIDSGSVARVAVLLGNGDGTFQEPPVVTDLPAGSGPAAAGIFGPGTNLDLAVVSEFESSEAVQILLGKGDGSFTVGQSYALSALNSTAIIASDFRNDGRTDLAVAEYEGVGVAVLLGNGDGTFEQPAIYPLATTTGVQAADMNGDGVLDLVASGVPGGLLSGDVGVFYGNGDGTFQDAVAYTAGQFPESIAVADFNGDHKPDVAVNNDTGAVVLLNTGVVTFSPTTPLAFPTQLVGTKSGSQTATLTNDGASPLTISSVGLRGKAFKMETTCGKSVAPSGSCSITANFAPNAQGYSSGTVSVTSSASSKPMVIELEGTGTVMQFSPGALTFGTQKVGTTSPSQDIQVTNTGGQTVSFPGVVYIYVGGTDYNDFSQTTTCGSTLAAGASCTVTVTFTPKKTGTRSAAVYFKDSGGGSPQTVALSGTGD